MSDTNNLVTYGLFGAGAFVLYKVLTGQHEGELAEAATANTAAIAAARVAQQAADVAAAAAARLRQAPTQKALTRLALTFPADQVEMVAKKLILLGIDPELANYQQMTDIYYGRANPSPTADTRLAGLGGMGGGGFNPRMFR